MNQPDYDTVAEPRSRSRMLQTMPVFGGLREGVLDFLLESARRVQVDTYRYFYREGDPASSLFVLERGQVQLLKRWQGRDYRLKTLETGDCFGQVALIDLQPRNTSSLAVESSCAIEISDQNLYQLYEHDKEQLMLLRMNMAREVCRRLREADDRAFAADMSALQVKKPLSAGGERQPD